MEIMSNTFLESFIDEKRKTELFENMVLLFAVQMKCWYAVCRIEETKLVCAIWRKKTLGLKTYLGGIVGPKMVIEWF